MSHTYPQRFVGQTQPERIRLIGSGRFRSAWLRFSLDREHISPRTPSLGLVRDADRGRLSWTPTFTFTLDAEVGPSGSRTGTSGRRESTTAATIPSGSRCMPSRSRRTSSSARTSSVYVEAGLQKDERQRRFEPGGHAAAGVTLGIYQA